MKNKDIVETITSKDDHVDDDCSYVRGSLYSLSDKNTEAIDLMMDLCREIESPRAFEVLSSMIKSQAEITDKLMDLQRKKQVIKQADRIPEKDITGKVSNTNVFIGSTTDLQRMLLEQDKGQVIDHDDSEE